jgi:hypothetical protein
MRRLLGLVAAAALLLLVVGPATANSDPHRFPLSFGVFDRGDCGFTVHFDTWSREYAKSSPDGSVLSVTGAAGGILTANGKTLELNLSGPMVMTFAPDGSWSQVSEGRGITWGPNLTAFGLPSNMVATSGLTAYTFNAAGEMTALQTTPHIMVDVCAALAP